MNFQFDQEIQLENERALLRPLLASDDENLMEIATYNKNLLQYSPMPIHSADLLKNYIKKALEDKKNQMRYPFVIIDKMTNTYAGSTSFLAVSNKDKRLEIGATWVGDRFQKTGLNRNCKHFLMAYAFDTLAFERVEFKTDERNAASRTAIEKIGGQFEGILRSHTLMSDGFRRNTVCYSILKNEWQDIKQRLLKH